MTLWTAARQAPLSMGILQARLLEWVAMPSSRETSQLWDQTQVSLIAGGLLIYHIQFNGSVMSNSLQSHGLQHTRPPCPQQVLELLKIMSIESVMPSNHLILCCCPLLLLPAIFPSIRVFSNESVLHIRWPKIWSFSFSISPSSEYS